MRPVWTYSARDQLEAAVVHAWRDQGYAAETIRRYLGWIRRFRGSCRESGFDDIERLTRRSVARFAERYEHERGLGRGTQRRAIHDCKVALRRWAVTVQILGVPVPLWRPKPPPGPFDAILGEYCEHGRRWRAAKRSTLNTEARQLRLFLSWLQRRRRLPLSKLTTDVIDTYLVQYGQKLKPRSLAHVCSYLRLFLRFLYATGRIPADLAPGVEAPLLRKHASPPQILRWEDVRRILSRIDRCTLIGKRDYAMFLLMAAYGMGASEVLALRLDDIDWRQGTLRVVRSKTGADTVLPLLGPVGNAVAEYLRSTHRKRSERRIFLHAKAPFHPMRSQLLRERWARYASMARVPVRGAHVLRHSHATRQVEAAAPPKVVSDILGHRDPRSLSTYASVATERLRSVCLPLP